MSQRGEWRALDTAIETPEYQEDGHCRVCGTKLVGRQQAFCSSFPRDRRGRPCWPDDGSTPCCHLWRMRFQSVSRARRYVYAHAGYACQSCGMVARSPLVTGGPEQADPSLLAMDHIIPLSSGGDDHPDNLQALCQSCHAEKTARDRGYRLSLRAGYP